MVRGQRCCLTSYSAQSSWQQRIIQLKMSIILDFRNPPLTFSNTSNFRNFRGLVFYVRQRHPVAKYNIYLSFRTLKRQQIKNIQKAEDREMKNLLSWKDYLGFTEIYMMGRWGVPLWRNNPGVRKFSLATRFHNKSQYRNRTFYRMHSVWNTY